MIFASSYRRCTRQKVCEEANKVYLCVAQVLPPSDLILFLLLILSLLLTLRHTIVSKVLLNVTINILGESIFFWSVWSGEFQIYLSENFLFQTLTIRRHISTTADIPYDFKAVWWFLHCRKVDLYDSPIQPFLSVFSSGTTLFIFQASELLE